MKQSVLVIGHADADGHLIAEQVRRNLSLIDTFDVSVVVDPARTKDHKSWLKLDEITEIEAADIVFFVDLMFAPMSFDDEAKALVSFVNRHSDTQFFLIDHHPLPLRKLAAADNLRVMYRPDVFECAVGPRSGMMVVAALCEGQGAKVADIRMHAHDVLALGMRRAAALGGNLPGEKLLTLLQFDCWSGLARLGEDDRRHHFLPRGRRPADRPYSAALRQLDETAEDLIAKRGRAGARVVRQKPGSVAMSYDFEVGRARYEVEAVGHRARVSNVSADARDLETIVTVLEVAALSLTTHPGATFSRARLIAEARRFAGEDLDLQEEDINIVLQKQSFLKRAGRELCMK